MGEDSERKGDQNLSPRTVLILLPGSYHLFLSPLQFWLASHHLVALFSQLFLCSLFLFLQYIYSPKLFLKLFAWFTVSINFQKTTTSSRLSGDWVISVPPTLLCWPPLGTGVRGQREGPAAWASLCWILPHTEPPAVSTHTGIMFALQSMHLGPLCHSPTAVMGNIHYDSSHQLWCQDGAVAICKSDVPSSLEQMLVHLDFPYQRHLSLNSGHRGAFAIHS